MRKIGLCGFLAISLMLAGCAEQLASLDRGLYGLADKVSTEDRVTGSRVLASGDRAAQIAEANKAIDAQLAQLTASGGKINAGVSASGYAKLQTILTRILSGSHFAGEAEQWKVVLLPENEFNAYVNGGTYVMVYKGLLDAVQSDDEIAAVIGHEIAHVAANHVGRQQAYKMASLLLDRKTATDSAFTQSYTLAQEQQADQIGTLYSALGGYDPMAASRLWARMYAQQGQYAGMISDHPLNGDRAANTQRLGKQVQQYVVAGKVNPDAQAILASNILWQKTNIPELEAGKGGGLAAVAQTAWTTYSAREIAKGLAESQEARAARVMAVQSALVIEKDIAARGPDSAVVQLRYTGSVPLDKLVLALSTSRARVLADVGAVQPGQSFVAKFEKIGSGVGRGGKVNISVDEVQ